MAAPCGASIGYLCGTTTESSELQPVCSRWSNFWCEDRSRARPSQSATRIATGIAVWRSNSHHAVRSPTAWTQTGVCEVTCRNQDRGRRPHRCKVEEIGSHARCSRLILSLASSNTDSSGRHDRLVARYDVRLALVHALAMAEGTLGLRVPAHTGGAGSADGHRLGRRHRNTEVCVMHYRTTWRALAGLQCRQTHCG